MRIFRTHSVVDLGKGKTKIICPDGWGKGRIGIRRTTSCKGQRMVVQELLKTLSLMHMKTQRLLGSLAPIRSNRRSNLNRHMGRNSRPLRHGGAVRAATSAPSDAGALPALRHDRHLPLEHFSREGAGTKITMARLRISALSLCRSVARESLKYATISYYPDQTESEPGGLREFARYCFQRHEGQRSIKLFSSDENERIDRASLEPRIRSARSSWPKHERQAVNDPQI